MLDRADPFWTAPLALISTMSPTLCDIQFATPDILSSMGLLVLSQIRRELDHALLLEITREGILRIGSAEKSCIDQQHSPVYRREDQLDDPSCCSVAAGINVVSASRRECKSTKSPGARRV